MPIYIVEGNDHRQISTDDLAKMMGVSKDILKKIEKNPVFEVNEKLVKPDKLNGGFIAPAGRQSKPRFFVKVDKNGIITDRMDGLRKEVRYALSIVPDRENERLSTYEPKRLRFEDLLAVVPNFEQALMMYLLPNCKDSPIVDQRNWHYTFQNKEAKAITINNHGKKIAMAMAYLNNSPETGGLTENQILLTAKGLYATNREMNYIPNPSAKNKTLIEIRADLINFALKEVDMFLASCDDNVNEFYGMLLDAVDRGIFGIRKTTHSKSWYWEHGPQKGTLICEISGGQNDFDVLKSAIEANPNAYYSNLTRAIAEVSGKENMSNFLKNKKISEDLREVIEKEKESLSQKANKNDVQYFDQQDQGEEGRDELLDDDTFKDMLDEGQQKGGETAEPVFKLPTEYNQLSEFTAPFNGGKRLSPKILGKFWALLKAGEVNAENITPLIAKLVEENI